MGRKYLMSWEGKPNYRWVKMFKGERFRISCAELNALPTAEASYTLANDWWKKKQAELTLDPAAELLYGLDPSLLREQIARGQHAEQLLHARDEPTFSPIDRNEPIVGVVKEDGHYNLPFLSHLVEKVNGKPVELDKTIGRQAERYLAVELARGKAPNTFANLRHFVFKFQEFPGLSAKTDISSIKSDTATDFYAWLRNGTLAEHSQKECWNVFKRFVRFAWGEGLLDLPKNLDSRMFSFGGSAKKVKTYPTEEIRRLLSSLSDRLRLYALLSLNCGMLGVDMAMLKHDELQGNRIVRKRTKTKEQGNVPEVEYLLWQETIDALNTYPRQSDTYVLTSKTGTPLWRCEVKNGKNVKVNLVHQQWKRGKVGIPLKALRSVSASLLESHSVYARYTTLFLGHAPASVKDRHYAAPPQQLFDEALLWLRQHFFSCCD
jgi:site-specific recombinase XerD